MSKVYAAINAVQAELAVTGITKDRTNNQGSGYKFRGIDDVYNAIAPLLAKHGLVIMPRMLKRECVERVSKQGGALFYVTVEAEFDFVAAEDGSKATARTFGEAMDSGDKATNKAMSAAYKYAAFQTFAIPTEGNHDADADTYEVKGGLYRAEQISPEKLASHLALIDAAGNVGELKLVLSVAMEDAGDDAEAIAKLNAAAQAKKSKAVAKAAAKAAEEKAASAHPHLPADDAARLATFGEL